MGREWNRMKTSKENRMRIEKRRENGGRTRQIELTIVRN